MSAPLAAARNMPRQETQTTTQPQILARFARSVAAFLRASLDMRICDWLL